ncbi:hypothetical protein IRJ41_001894 [Triplophysa rosa]|uniref:ribonuclease H n=1 Tax=Triplophysa rosa TaxID=992332 RepID=A0A9W7WN14_TRIRA|nr:hypothetical protein IRJ41_001894 [Triplophysa rosa]
MDPAVSDAETRDSPRSRTNLPPPLDEYEVGYQPSGDPPPKAFTSCPSQHRSSSRKTSHSGTSSHSRTSRHSVTSSGVYLPPELSSVQTAALEERIKQRQFDNREYQRLQTQAKEAQRIQEEALTAKEALSNHLERQRKLQEAETELEVAKLVSSMLTTDSGSATPMPSHSPASSFDPTQLIHSSPAVCPQSPSLHQQLSSESPVVTSSVQPCSADQVMMDTSSQLSLKRLALTIPATEPVSAPDASALHLLSQTAPSRVSTVSQTLPTTAPVRTALSASYVVSQTTSGNTVMSTAAPSVRTGRPAVPLQPITAAFTSPYVIQQALFPPVTPHAHPVQPPVTSQWTSALSPQAPSFTQPPSFMHLPRTGHDSLCNANAFDSFALSVQSLVGMLRTLEGQNGYELMCGSHVDRLLVKLPPAYRDGFVEYCLSKRILQTGTDKTYTLPDLAAWLEISSVKPNVFPAEPQPFLLTSEGSSKGPDAAAQKYSTKSKPMPYCPYCDNRDHYLNACDRFKRLTTTQIITWIKEEKRCWRCGRNHAVETCNLKRPCSVCKEVHLTVLHDSVSDTSRAVLMVSSPSTRIYLDRPNRSPKVMLKVVKVLLHNGRRTMETYAVLDDGSERTIVLQPVVQQLKLTGTPELLPLQTIQQCHTELEGSSISFEVSSVFKPRKRFAIHNAFTATGLCLAEHNYPVAALQKAYRHLKDLPLPPVDRVQPLLLIGSDMPHLLTPVQSICQGPIGGPIAIQTSLGWSLQGPMSPMQPSRGFQQYLHMTVPTNDDLIHHVERLWQVETLPYNTKMVTRSIEDKEAYTLLQNATVRVTVDGVQRYAMPLLRRNPLSLLNAEKTAVLPSLRRTERRLARDPERTKVYCSEISKLELAGYVAKITAEEEDRSAESWFILHHIVHHNGQSLNDQLLPGPNLGPPLLGVLLRFRQHSVAISGDIKGMFHQVRLLPGDKSVLRFIWRDMCREAEPDIYEWQVLPFGTTCSPCCAIYALQHHVQGHKGDMDNLVDIVEQSFYVDNCLHSVQTTSEAKEIVDGLRQFLSQGGFEIRQWACNLPSAIQHLPTDARSTNSYDGNPLSDTLGYNLRSVETFEPTMRNMYRTLASQYDPLGFIIPFTTRAKVIIQDLWKHNLGWDDPIKPLPLKEKWLAWVAELPKLPQLQFTRAYTPASADNPSAIRELHVFSDASERAYGSVAYFRTTDEQGQVIVNFVLARSRVAPRKCLSGAVRSPYRCPVGQGDPN